MVDRAESRRGVFAHVDGSDVLERAEVEVVAQNRRRLGELFGRAVERQNGIDGGSGFEKPEFGNDFVVIHKLLCPKQIFGGLLGSDFPLKGNHRVDESLGARRTAAYVDVHGDDFVYTLQRGISPEHTARRRARAHSDNPLGRGHLVVDSFD